MHGCGRFRQHHGSKLQSLIIAEWYFIYIAIFFQGAKKRGAQVVRDIWTESDANGSVRFATVKTVSSFEKNN